MCSITIQKQKGFFDRMFSCCSKGNKQGDDFVEIPSDNYSSKGFFLDSVWRKGIPARFRKKIWPFVIKNNLEISKSLYDILGERVKREKKMI